MADNHYDLVVIGSGPAGEKGAAQAAYHGKRVALVEKAPNLGGAGINTGTLPSKTLRETALYFSGLRQRGLYGIDYSLKEGLTVEEFLYRKTVVVETQWATIRRNLRRHQVDVYEGTASLKDAHTVCVTPQEGEETNLSCDFILIATGSSPVRPPDIPFDDHTIFDSDTILSMKHIPKNMAVVGAGVIGSEYASLFAALGVDVTLIDGRERMLGFLDHEISERLQIHLEYLGVDFRLETRVEQVHIHDHRVDLKLSSGETIQADTVLMAAGRKSNVEALGLEEVGVELGKRGLILVNDHFRTNIPNIFAAGDVIGHPALASTSMEQARVAMVHAFDLHYKEQISPVLPFAVYTIPEISTAGLTEQQCIEQGIDYLVGRSYYDLSPRGQIIGDAVGMLKLIFSPQDKRVLGIHHIGEMASELVHIGMHVMMAQGTIDAFIQAVYNYPTLADSYKYAAYDGLAAWEAWVEEKG